MISEYQTDVVEFLAAPSTHGTATVERIDTHSAIVFLAGERAYKLKRAVRFDYLDFSIAERRRAMCDAEVRLNRRTAPDIYRGVVPITREPGGTLALGGSGAPIDWVVEMNRFSQEALFDRLAASGHLDLELMPPLAAAIAEFHRIAEPRTDHGGTPGMAWVIEGNAAGFAEYGQDVLDLLASRRLTEASRAELDTRKLTRILRERGAQNGCIVAASTLIDADAEAAVAHARRAPSMSGLDLAKEVSCTGPYEWTSGAWALGRGYQPMAEPIVPGLAPVRCRPDGRRGAPAAEGASPQAGQAPQACAST